MGGPGSQGQKSERSQGQRTTHRGCSPPAWSTWSSPGPWGRDRRRLEDRGARGGRRGKGRRLALARADGVGGGGQWSAAPVSPRPRGGPMWGPGLTLSLTGHEVSTLECPWRSHSYTRLDTVWCTCAHVCLYIWCWAGPRHTLCQGASPQPCWRELGVPILLGLYRGSRP